MNEQSTKQEVRICQCGRVISLPTWRYCNDMGCERKRTKERNKTYKQILKQKKETMMETRESIKKDLDLFFKIAHEVDRRKTLVHYICACPEGWIIPEGQMCEKCLR